MGKAKKLYKKARDYTNLSRVLENEGRFSKAVEVFDEAGKRFEALEKAKKSLNKKNLFWKKTFVQKSLLVSMLKSSTVRREEKMKI